MPDFLEYLWSGYYGILSWGFFGNPPRKRIYIYIDIYIVFSSHPQKTNPNRRSPSSQIGRITIAQLAPLHGGDQRSSWWDLQRNLGCISGSFIYRICVFPVFGWRSFGRVRQVFSESCSCVHGWKGLAPESVLHVVAAFFDHSLSNISCFCTIVHVSLVMVDAS